jgi:hypothetical protein
VTLTDGLGTAALATLSHATEVAIVAWRPDRSGTTLYRVRAMESGLEGWLAVDHLRSLPVAVPPSAPPSSRAVLPAPARPAKPVSRTPAKTRSRH